MLHRVGVRVPMPAPRRRGRHIVRGDFFTKVTSHSFCRGSFPNRTRYRWAPVWVRRCAAVFSGHQKISILDRRDRCGRIARPAIRPAALLRRTSVFVSGENLGAGAALPTPSIEILKGGGRLRRLGPKKKDTTYVVSFFLEGTVKIDISP